MAFDALFPGFMGRPQMLEPPGGLGAAGGGIGAPRAAPTASSGGFADWFGGGGQAEPNYALMALGNGIANRDVAGSFRDYSSAMASSRQRHDLKRWLVDKGMTEADAAVYAANPSMLKDIGGDNPNPKDDLLNAGDGRLYNARTGQWITAPDTGQTETKAPDITELFDENGRPYKAQWDAKSGSWQKLGGSKPTGTTEAVNRNRQLYSVVEPEARNLLGDQNVPGKFDSLSSLGNQAGDVLGGIGKGYGVDLSGYTTSADYQAAKNSLKTIVASYLYSVSGATATPGEVENLSSTLMPRPGEAQESLNQKKQRIQTMAAAVRQAAYPAGASGDMAPPPEGGGDVIDYKDYFGAQ
jgi:hypothetical protein